MPYSITAFYYFIPVQNPQELESLKSDLSTLATKIKLNGLVILGKEGINATVASDSSEGMQELKSWILSRFHPAKILFKDSFSDLPPFRRFSVKIREEIVTLKTPELTPDMRQNHHLSPQEWEKVMKEEDVIIVDTRNWYEYKIGTFQGAINPKIDQFTEFPEWIEQQNYDKNKKMLIFCTGGIRCEKGILEMQRRGFQNVYQLEGGILNYLEQKSKKPEEESLWKGECFVFDHRVAVDEKLQPSKRYQLCPHCGQPAEQLVQCSRCDSRTCICEDCLKKPFVAETCSKNCAYHFEKFPGKKGEKQVLPFMLSSK